MGPFSYHKHVFHFSVQEKMKVTTMREMYILMDSLKSIFHSFSKVKASLHLYVTVNHCLDVSV